IKGKKSNGKGYSPETLLVELEINGQPVPGIVRVERLIDGSLALPLDAWKAARLRIAGEPLALPDGQRGYTLESLPDVKYRIDLERLALVITAPAAAFDSNADSLGDAR